MGLSFISEIEPEEIRLGICRSHRDDISGLSRPKYWLINPNLLNFLRGREPQMIIKLHLKKS